MKRKLIFILDLLIVSAALTLGLQGWKVGVKQANAVWSWKQTQNSDLLATIPNDPDLNKSWVFEGADHLDVLQAWRIQKGSRHVVVAIIDTGIDKNHPEINSNLWKNASETGAYIDQKTGKIKYKENDGLDNDHNGFADDVYGWDFTKDTCKNKLCEAGTEPVDEHGHGTHVAGIIGAQGNNGQGISGMSPQVSLMILKYYDTHASGADNLKNSIRALKYAVDHGAHIINYSGGGPQFVKEEFEILKQAEAKGILIVAAAGNEGEDIEKQHYYPASYDLNNILSVASINQKDELSPSSNYGKKVDVAAPGENIYSTLPLNKGKYGSMTGTSQATAFVTGIAALVLAQNKEWIGHVAAERIKSKITNSVKKLDNLKNKVISSGKVSAVSALQ